MPRSDAPTATDSPATADEAATAVQGGAAYLADIERRLAPYFERTEPRQRAMAYLRGLLSSVERKNSWQLAEVSGDATPYGLQHLLRRALWDPDAVRDALRRYLLAHLGDAHAVLVIDETGFLKKGQYSAGVARQYSGTAGRIENCQIGVFLAYASRHGQALLDRELYLPKEWAENPGRCRQAGVPAERRFATKPQLAKAMLQRALAAGVPARWLTGDSSYGDDRRLRMWLEAQAHAYVLAVSGKEYVWLDWHQRQVKTVLTALPEDGWSRLSAGDGTKGPRWYDWRWLPLADPLEPGWCRWLLVRRRISEPRELQAYVVFAPQDTTLAEVVRVAGTRWTIESCFEAAKSEVGLDHYEVRSWTGWYRHITLAMWALALLTVLRAGAVAVEVLKKSLPPPQERRSLAAFKASRGLQSP
ncbi:MAG: IS701 family transposase [Candidatus Tectomicrobia bacterium]|nr:IS701 family transposase [Candidatus Tectomicrobia bacterium]